MHHQFLFLSHLTRRWQYDVFAAICRVSRDHNAAAGIRGMLLFDGARFCELLEGPWPAIRNLMAKIALDSRHESLSLLVDRPRAEASRLTSWVPGFCQPDDLDAFEGPQALRDDAAVVAFHDVVTRADLSP